MVGFLLVLAQARAEESVPTIRILLQDGAKSVTVECRGALDLKTPKAPKPLLQFGRVTPTSIGLAEGKFKFLDRTFEEPWLTFATKQEPLRIGERSYRGLVHLVREGAGFKVVNEVDLETYLLGVVGAEIGPGSPIESLKAQAIAARSYAAASIDGFPIVKENRPLWDVHDDTRSQVYVGVPARSSNVEHAVRDTASVVVMYKGKIVRTYFSSSCGGHTRGLREWTGAAEIPPLSGVPCEFCKDAAPWTRRFTPEELGAKFKNRTGGKPVSKMTVKESTASGRPAVVLLEFGSAKAQLAAKEVGDALGLPTALYTISESGGAVILSGAGNGHGVGLCQVGAIRMGLKGAKCEEILAHYFPQSTLAPGYASARK